MRCRCEFDRSRAEFGTVTVDHRRWLQRNAVAEKGPPSVLVGDETDVLALGLFRRAKIKLGRQPTHVGLRQFADRQSQTFENRLFDDMQHVGLILGVVDPPTEARTGAGANDASVVAGGEQIENRGHQHDGRGGQT